MHAGWRYYVSKGKAGAGTAAGGANAVSEAEAEGRSALKAEAIIGKRSSTVP